MNQEDCSDFKEFLLLHGFGVIKVEKKENGDLRFTLINLDEKENAKLGELFYLTLEKQRPSPISEFLNTCEEIHAFVFGIIHSFKMIKPIPFNSLDEQIELSPDLIEDLKSEYHYYLAGFWGIRILIVIILVLATGSTEIAMNLLGW